MSNKKVLLISEKQIKDQSTIEQNIDSKLLSKAIQLVQDIQLKPVLGATLYKSIIEEVNTAVSTSGTLSAGTKELLDDYITPFMVYAVLIEFMVINNYKVSNKGLVKLNDNSATSTSQADFEYVKNYYDNYLSTYKMNLIQYLKDNKLVADNDIPADTNVTATAIGWFLDVE